jgi:hypothetical protein
LLKRPAEDAGGTAWEGRQVDALLRAERKLRDFHARSPVQASGIREKLRPDGAAATIAARKKLLNPWIQRASQLAPTPVRGLLIKGGTNRRFEI